MGYEFNPFQEAWLDALESGMYPQGINALCTLNQDGVPAGFDCLGVLCEVFIEMFPGEVELTFGLDKARYDGRSLIVPPLVQQCAGLRDPSGIFKEPVQLAQQGLKFYTVRLTAMNDVGTSHKDIAAYIRQNPTNVFVEE